VIQPISRLYIESIKILIASELGWPSKYEYYAREVVSGRKVPPLVLGFINQSAAEAHNWICGKGKHAVDQANIKLTELLNPIKP
jgi:hypothetical protein